MSVNHMTKGSFFDCNIELLPDQKTSTKTRESIGRQFDILVPIL